MKILKWISNNIFLILSLFFLAFIPLYPKLPLLDIKNTWVYIRLEDVLVALGLFIWFFQLIRGRVSFKTPLTLPILIFWAFGALATIHAVLIIFPSISNVFSNVAFLSFVRRIEYISLFFIAFSAVKDRRLIPLVTFVLVITLFLVAGYGIGQKYFGFPAFLTMNEEYAKGVPITLSPGSRVPSTFGGHYDLAAYLVLILPILTSMIFGFRNWIVRFILFISVALGFLLLFMTVSRVSFFVLLISLVLLLLFQRKKIVFFLLPIGAVALIFFSLNFSDSILQRFGNTVKEVDVLVDAKTGEAIGHVKTVKTSTYKNKLILSREFADRSDLNILEKDPYLASSSAIIPLSKLPPEVIAVVPPDTPTGENLPQGTGYVNLTLSPVTKRSSVFFFDRSEMPKALNTSYVTRFSGNFVVKRAKAYDLSFTTRFQGEWPNAIKAFKRNVLFGSGYSSISLAVDNNFLRILGEVGLVGFITFFGIFVTSGIYIKKILPEVDSPVVKSFIIGFAVGLFGLLLNATFIDVFEASKVAYVLWLLMGVTIGVTHLYQKNQFSLFAEFKKALVSRFAISLYIAFLGFVLFWPAVTGYFLGDDFIWLRWVSDCSVSSPSGICPSLFERVLHYFTNADGFFYRPGTKIYFLFMYSFFWLNQEVYHIVSISLHVIVAILMFLFIQKVLRNNLFAGLSAILFLILSGYTEIVFWAAATGHLFNAAFVLLSLLLFIKWEEKGRSIYFILSLLSSIFSLLFHELGVIVPLLIIMYKFVSDERLDFSAIYKRVHFRLLFVPLLIYLIIRFLAQSHWFSGDYNYNLLKLPFNVLGNAIGYLFLGLFGPSSLSVYEQIRTVMKDNILVVSVLLLLMALILVYYILQKNVLKRVKDIFGRIERHERQILIFSILFFLIALLPFLPLGNITSRYSYLASGGLSVLIVYFLVKLYRYILKSGKEIAIVSLITLLAVFCLFHIVQTQQIQSDWHESGVRTRHFITSLDAMYQDRWGESQMEFHFVNVPIRVGNAWMFPVGLQDALWFVVRNPNVKVYQHQSFKEALSAVEGDVTEKVFLFQDDGSIVEARKTRAGVKIYDK